MEISAFWIYLIGIVDSLKHSIEFLLFILFMVLVGSGGFLTLTFVNYDLFERTKEEQEKRNILIKWFKRIVIGSSITWILLGSICTLLPSSKTIVAMITVPAIVNNEEVQKLPNNIVQFVNNYLENNIRKYQKEN